MSSARAVSMRTVHDDVYVRTISPNGSGVRRAARPGAGGQRLHDAFVNSSTTASRSARTISARRRRSPTPGSTPATPRSVSAPGRLQRLVERLQRSRPERPGPDRLRAERQPARGRHARARSPRQRAIAVGELFPQSADRHGELPRTSRRARTSPTRRREQLLRQLGERPSTSPGRSTSGAASAARSSRRTTLVDASVDDYDNVMVTLIGDVASAYVQYRIFEQQLVYTRENVEHPARLAARSPPSSWQGRADQRAGRRPGDIAAGAARGDDPAARDRAAPGEQPALRAARHSADRSGRAARQGADPDVAAGGRRRHPGRPDPPPAGPPRGRAAGRGPERPDRRRRGRLLSGLLHQRHASATRRRTSASSSTSKSFTGQIGPAFQWNILNYGRILNNVRLPGLQDAGAGGASTSRRSCRRPRRWRTASSAF